MALTFPYTYYSCPCTDSSPSAAPSRGNAKAASPDEDEERTFDPRSPRANFSLFPLEHLLYCTECHQIRCTRCINEEVVCWYCPSCLFEVPSSTVRSEGTRCTRSCYNCPICTAHLTVNTMEMMEDEEGNESAAGGFEGALPRGPFVLVCSYCNWTSLDIGVEFDRHNNITGQLARLKNWGDYRRTPKDRESSQAERLLGGSKKGDSEGKSEDQAKDEYNHDNEDLFANLSSFYKTQFAETVDAHPWSGSDYSFASPSSITRLLNLYSSTPGKRNKRSKPSPMRESLLEEEGLQVFDPGSDEATVTRLKTEGWESTTSMDQRLNQDRRYEARFVDGLRPVATLLRTKRSKRCKACRTLLSRPEPKVSSTRYKIKVLALNNIPKVTMRPFNPASVASPTTPTTPSSLSRASQVPAILTPLLTRQFLLTLTNPLFDPIRVTLATPAVTPGRIQSRVTILCPQFEVGANTDVWDEALGSSTTSREVNRRSGMLLSGAEREEGKTAEAGKVWEKGRNWTSVVVEVVPGILPGSTGSGTTNRDEEGDELDEDEDVLEIPVFVRTEYETEGGGDEHKISAGGGAKEKREVAFWSVLGVGRIAA
jgi:dynactin 4